MDIELNHNRLMTEKLIENKIRNFIDIMVRNDISPVVLGKMIAQQLQLTHNTLQQLFIRTLHQALKNYSQHALTDIRNAQAVNWAKQATDIKVDFPYI